MTFTQSVSVLFQYLLPHHALSRFIRLFTQSQCPPIKNAIIHYFVRHFSVDMSSAVNPDPLSYESFNAFFTRALKPGLRVQPRSPEAIASPVDGCVSQLGEIHDGAVFQAKGHTFDVTALLGGDALRARAFTKGCFATLYLSPKDYHRIHMPVRGELREMIHIPGRIFSVNPCTTEQVPGLFARNERVVAIFDTALGTMALVLVGAMICASISTVWAGEVTPPQRKSIRVWSYDKTPVPIVLEQGAEVGHFMLGSTVIVLFSQGVMRWDAAIQAGVPVQVGQTIGEKLSATDVK